MARIGFAGLGLMGSRMARSILRHGHELFVWNRTPEKAEALAAEGARVARTPRDLAEATDIVVGCVSDPNAVGRLVFAEDGIRPAARPGFRYIECSTVSPGMARRLGEALRARGADVLEAPVTGSKTGAEKGTLVFMTGGARETHDQLLPVLMSFGSKAIYCGELGQASVVKLVGNTIISFMVEGLCEGVTVARRAGVALETVLEVVMASGFASPYYSFKGDAIARRDWDEHFSVDLMHKDQTLMLEEAAQLRVPMPGLAAIREVFQSARGHGWGKQDIIAIVKAIEAAAGIDPGQ
jgi:3-hydroxyisobutyrate dehydrogenase-like beta-hydroxyacid dehydrogenase